MSAVVKPFTWFYHEFGLDSIHETGRNAYLIILARSCRMFAYGTISLILGELVLCNSMGSHLCELVSPSLVLEDIVLPVPSR